MKSMEIRETIHPPQSIAKFFEDFIYLIYPLSTRRSTGPWKTDLKAFRVKERVLSKKKRLEIFGYSSLSGVSSGEIWNISLKKKRPMFQTGRNCSSEESFYNIFHLLIFSMAS